MVSTDMTTELPDGVYTADWGGMVLFPSRMVAAGFPLKPPRQWFDNPTLKELTPLCVDQDGRVYGHIASWKMSHIGMAGGIKAPKSKSNYAFFATGLLETLEGDRVNVGQITLTGGHANLNDSVANAVAHYDNTLSAVMDVSVGEDKHGIWVAGALRPDVDDLKLRSIRASSVSGDWRPINGNLELVAVCAVNVPGFPIPRAKVASGATLALVAAGTEQLVEAAMQAHEAGEMPEPGELTIVDDSNPADDSETEVSGVEETRELVVVSEEVAYGLLTLDERLARVEAALADQVLGRTSDPVRESIQQAVEKARNGDTGNGDAAPVDVSELRSRVHREPVATVDVDALRSRVHV